MVEEPTRKAYLLLKIDDHSFAQPLFANLFRHAPGNYTLV